MIGSIDIGLENRLENQTESDSEATTCRGIKKKAQEAGILVHRADQHIRSRQRLRSRREPCFTRRLEAIISDPSSKLQIIVMQFIATFSYV